MWTRAGLNWARPRLKKELIKKESINEPLKAQGLCSVWSDLSSSIQAHMLVCRALSNMLLLPWPNLPESEQQWQSRSTNHASLLAALTREYQSLRGTVTVTPPQPDLDNGQSALVFALYRWKGDLLCENHFKFLSYCQIVSFILKKKKVSRFFIQKASFCQNYKKKIHSEKPQLLIFIC